MAKVGTSNPDRTISFEGCSAEVENNNKTSPTLKGSNIPFVKHLRYLGVIFDRRNAWTIHIGKIELKAF